MGDSPHLRVGNSYFATRLFLINRQAVTRWGLMFPEFGIDDPYFNGVFHHCH